jgi:hypothetical protein
VGGIIPESRATSSFYPGGFVVIGSLDVARRSRAIFGAALVVGAVMSSAFLRGE